MTKIITALVLMVSSVVMGAAANIGWNVREERTPQFAKNGFQIRQIINREIRHHRRSNHNNREFYETRNVWKGNKEYRDTYRITIKNGKRHEKRVSHIRIN